MVDYGKSVVTSVSDRSSILCCFSSRPLPPHLGLSGLPPLPRPSSLLYPPDPPTETVLLLFAFVKSHTLLSTKVSGTFQLSLDRIVVGTREVSAPRSIGVSAFVPLTPESDFNCPSTPVSGPVNLHIETFREIRSRGMFRILPERVLFPRTPLLTGGVGRSQDGTHSSSRVRYERFLPKVPERQCVSSTKKY